VVQASRLSRASVILSDIRKEWTGETPVPRLASREKTAMEWRIHITNIPGGDAGWPARVSVPVPRGQTTEAFCVARPDGSVVPAQHRVLIPWPDAMGPARCPGDPAGHPPGTEPGRAHERSSPGTSGASRGRG
jgi:hypothetical protein